MGSNQSGMLPADRDTASNYGSNNQFNIPALNHNVGGHPGLHSNPFGEMPAQDSNTPTLGQDNGVQNQVNMPAQAPNSAPYLSNQSGPNQLNMPNQGLNRVAYVQNQGSPIRLNLPGQDIIALSHGQNQGTQNAPNFCFPDHLLSLGMLQGASGYNHVLQRGQNSLIQGHNQGATGYLNLPSPDQQPQYQGPNLGVYRQDHLTQQISPGARADHQAVAQSFSIPSNEHNTESHEGHQGGQRPINASPVQSPAPRYIPGAHSPISAAEPSAVNRGRLNPTLHGIQTPILARPRSTTIQHSPPRRAFHSPITPDIALDVDANPTQIRPTTVCLSPSHANLSIPPNPPPVATNRIESVSNSSTRVTAIRERISVAEYLKRLNLQYFTEGRAEKNALESDLAVGWARSDANDNLQMLYAGERRLMEVNKLWEKYGRWFRMYEDEIEELWGDLMVRDEEEPDGEGSVSKMKGKEERDKDIEQ
jgi:hypothetical protein